MPRIKIAYITTTEATDRRTWSGTNYFLQLALQKQVGDVELIGPVHPTLVIFFFRAFNFLSLVLFRKRIDWSNSTILSKIYSKIIQKKISNQKYDLIVVPGSTALIAHLQTTIPIVYIGDRTTMGAYEYHEQLKHLWGFSFRQSITTDRLAFEKSLFVTFPSSWACDSVVQDYGIPREKVFTISFGANFDQFPDRNKINLNSINKTFTLLFVAVTWKQKGGNIAFDCLQHLRQKGVDARLVVCGCEPDQDKISPYLEVVPFLDKNNPTQFDQLKKLFLSSDIFILPTRVDAYGIAFCEASAYGLPSLGTDTGGVSGALHEGINGYRFSIEAGGKEYAEKILELLSDEKKYFSLKESSRKLFEDKLNWDAWARTFCAVLSTKIPEKSALIKPE